MYTPLVPISKIKAHGGKIHAWRGRAGFAMPFFRFSVCFRTLFSTTSASWMTPLTYLMGCHKKWTVCSGTPEKNDSMKRYAEFKHQVRVQIPWCAKAYGTVILYYTELYSEKWAIRLCVRSKEKMTS
jgi:hypothetical protein